MHKNHRTICNQCLHPVPKVPDADDSDGEIIACFDIADGEMMKLPIPGLLVHPSYEAASGEGDGKDTKTDGKNPKKPAMKRPAAAAAAERATDQEAPHQTFDPGL